MWEGSGRRRALVVPLVALIAVVALPAVRAEETVEVAWTLQFGTPEDDLEWGPDVAIGPGGIFVAGSTAGALPGQTYEGEGDNFLRKYAPDGTESWTRQFGTPGVERQTRLATDATGVYIVGETSAALPGQSNGGGFDSFIRKYDPDGNELWTRQSGALEPDGARSVAVSGSGVYVAGQIADDAFVRKHSPDGTGIWDRRFGTPRDEIGVSVAADGTGVYVAGLTAGAFPGQTSSGGHDAFVRKYDPDGNELWTRQFGTVGDDVAWAVGVAPSSIFVAGNTNGTLPGQTNAGGADAFVRKYDPDGNEIWTRQFGTSDFDIALDVAVDAFDVYLGGWTAGALPGQSSAGATDTFVRKYDAGGNEVWTLQIGTNAVDDFNALAVDSPDAYMIGRTWGVFPGQTSAGGSDAFFVKFTMRSDGTSCPSSHGFWMNHEDAWPVDALRLGTETYGRAELVALLRMPPRGDASLVLAHQLIAARLNVASGGDSTPIEAAIAEADGALGMFPDTLPYAVRPSTPEGRTMIATAGILDAYNNEQLTPNCHDAEDDNFLPPGERTERGVGNGEGSLDGTPLLPPSGDARPLAGWASLLASVGVAIRIRLRRISNPRRSR